MTRALAVLLGSLLLAVAAPRPALPHATVPRRTMPHAILAHSTMRRSTLAHSTLAHSTLARLVLAHPALPLPPPLPADPPTDEAAPMPDANLQFPSARARDETEFALRIYEMHDFGTGAGFIPGSEYQSPEQRRPLQTPGFMVTVPLR